MGASILLEPFRRVRDALMRFAARQLTKPLKRYTLVYPNDLTELKRQIRKGDVLLVEGNERISEVIKYLTQSSWSHSALYVGRRGDQARPGAATASSPRNTAKKPTTWWSRRWCRAESC